MTIRTEQAEAIVCAVDAALHRGHGAQDVIPSGFYGIDAFETLGDNASSARAAVRPQVEAILESVDPHEGSPCIEAAFTIRTITIEVTVRRHIPFTEAVIHVRRKKQKALALADSGRIERALSRHRNLLADPDGRETCLVSGRLVYQGSSHELIQVRTDDAVTGDEGGLMITRHRFTGHVRVDRDAA